jgi:hypothetical protein
MDVKNHKNGKDMTEQDPQKPVCFRKNPVFFKKPHRHPCIRTFIMERAAGRIEGYPCFPQQDGIFVSEISDNKRIQGRFQLRG